MALTAAACLGGAPDQGDVVLSVGYAAASEGNELIAQLTGEGLLRTGPDGRPELLLAEKVTIGDAGTTLVVELRQDVSFHDGSPLRAADVKTSLDRVRGDQQRPLLGDIESIETQGPHSLVIRLSRRSAQLVQFELGVRIEKTVDEGRAVGTGPFQLETLGEEDTTLRVNPYYHRGIPVIDVVRLKSYPTHRTAWAALMRSEIDFLLEVPTLSREFVDANSGVRVFSHRSPYAFALVFNTRRPPFDHRQVRVALSHAVDRDAIVAGAFRGHAEVASGVWPEHWVYNGEDRRYPHDPTEADRRLAQLGFERPSSIDLPADGFESRLRFEALVGYDQPPFERIALLIQRQLRQVGVEMNIDAKPFRDVETQLGTRPDSWDAVLLPLNTARNLTRLYTYWHSSQQVAVSGFTGADDALEALRSSEADASTQTAARKVQQILFEEAPAVFLAASQEARAVSRKFVVPDEPGRDVVETLWRWRLAGEMSEN